jgi:predicted Zn-dependent protease
MKSLILISCLSLAVSCATNPVTGNKSFILTSEHEENSLGEQAYRDILKKERVVHNELSQRVEKIGRRLAQVAGRPDYQWEFATLDNPNPNAFCLPGGKIAYHTGMSKVAETDDEIAAIIGHEIGHALARHGGQRLTAQMGQQVLVGLVAVAGLAKASNENRTMALSLLGIGTTVGLILPFSRSNETEADVIGLHLMKKAGYDGQAAVSVWEKMEQRFPNKTPTFLSTHPSNKARRDRLKTLL